MVQCQMASFLRGGLAVDTVSNLWLGRVFLISEFDTLGSFLKEAEISYYSKLLQHKML